MNLYTNRHLNEIRSGGLPVFKRKVKSFFTYFLTGKVKDLTGKVKESLRRHGAKKVASAVRRDIKNKTKVVVVYDHKVSPLTYGDYLCVVFMTKYFLVHGLNVNLYIIDGEYRGDQSDSLKTRCAQFLLEQVNLATFINKAYEHNFYCKKLSWEVAKTELQKIKLDRSNYIFLKDCVFQRQPIYHNAFNILNYLVFSMNQDLLPKFLLNRKKFEGSLGQIASILPHPYIVFNVRYNPDWGMDRNTSPELFADVVRRLRVNYPEFGVVVASDQQGCNYFKKVAEDNNIECFFSKHLGLPDEFISDVLLILGSNKYFQINGGGLGNVALFSSIPYEYIAPNANELPWSGSAFASWQFSNQTFKNVYYRGKDASGLDFKPL